MIILENDIKSTYKYFEDSPVLRKNGNEYILEGMLHCCVQGYEEFHDVFNVTIVIPFNFPFILPAVFEKDGKIPRDVDHHVDKSGKCCIGTNIALFDYMHLNDIISFHQYLEQIIIIYFFQIKYFMSKGQWLESPEAHYAYGLIDSYKRIFGITENDLRKKISTKFKRYDRCLCNSNRRFDKCHGKYIPVEQVQQDFKIIMSQL